MDKTTWRVYGLLVILTVIVTAAVVIYMQRAKSLACYNFQDFRAVQICNATESNLSWKWLGHATISPGWTIGFDGTKNIFCSLQMSYRDIPALKAMQGSVMDSRLQGSVDRLLLLLNGSHEPVTSIFNPSNPVYLLKGGCPAT